MLALEPEFIVPTGDTVYYDSDEPLVTNIELARYHWRRMYSYPLLKEFHRQVPGYWEKDDHDSYANDNWPGLVRDYMGTFSFEQGPEGLCRAGSHGRQALPTLSLGPGPGGLADRRPRLPLPQQHPRRAGEVDLGRGAEEMAQRHAAGVRRRLARTQSARRRSSARTARTKTTTTPTSASSTKATSFGAGRPRTWVTTSSSPAATAIGSITPSIRRPECRSSRQVPASDQHASGSPGVDRRVFHRFHRVSRAAFCPSTPCTRGRPRARSRFRFHSCRRRESSTNGEAFASRRRLKRTYCAFFPRFPAGTGRRRLEVARSFALPRWHVQQLSLSARPSGRYSSECSFDVLHHA